MAYVIKDECIACGACIEECPVEAIVAGDDQYTIDADKCIDCGACGSPTCRAFAEDIVKGTADPDGCVVKQ